MQISIVCSSATHPVYSSLENWCLRRSPEHEIDISTKVDSARDANILFLVSCGERISEKQRSRFDHVLVLHASDLPVGRGWSPHIWDILAGKDTITVSLLDASDPVDTGAIWAKESFKVQSNFLWFEINELLFQSELSLMDRGIDLIKAGVKPTPQPQQTYPRHRKRSIDDSKLDPNLSIAVQFDLLRVSDPQRFPAHFTHRGRRFKINIEAF